MSTNDISIGGIILSGGKSSRMGTDKGLIDFGGKKLISYPIELLTPFCNNLIISTNQEGYENLGFTLVNDTYPNCGPIGGIHAALKASKFEWNLVLGCDNPFIHPDLIRYLLNTKDGYEVVIPIHDNNIEPLVGIYHKSLADFFEEKILKKEFKIRDLLEERKTNYLQVDALLDKYPLMFQNFNSQSDIRGLT